MGVVFLSILFKKITLLNDNTDLKEQYRQLENIIFLTNFTLMNWKDILTSFK
jgi:hypothetical protein